ncbi:hypothetical protein ACGFIF_43700 [Kribbella sp. NPDC049174]
MINLVPPLFAHYADRLEQFGAGCPSIAAVGDVRRDDATHNRHSQGSCDL